MKRFWSMALLFAIFAPSAICQPPKSPSQASIDEQHTKWIAAALQEIETISVGMTRADLMRVFTTEGGMTWKDATSSRGKYVYKKCPYIKIDVTLEIANPNNDSETDRIKEISRPYLEWTIAD